MPFPKRYAEFAARTRVAAGFAVLALFLWFARPTPVSLGVGSSIAVLGLGLRAWAAGHLRKNRELSVSGPYAHVRNPLYLGTLIAGAGFAVAGGRLGVGALLIAFFTLFYLPVVEEEEKHLRKILPGYEEYERRVPRLAPSLSPRWPSERSFSPELYRQNREYQALLGAAAALVALALKLALGEI